MATICGDRLRYGFFDGFRLDHDVLGGDQLTLYHPDHIGRGFTIDWQNGRTDKVDLMLPLPTSSEDIDDFYNTVERILGVWKKHTIVQDSNEIASGDISEQRRSMKEFSLNVLHHMMDTIEQSTFYCALVRPC
jgi:hypothetical protein